MKKIIFLGTFFIFINVVAQNSNNVIYGEKKTYYKPSENVFGLFLDKNGDLYADDHITNDELIACSASLQEFYKNNENRFVEIAGKYNLILSGYSATNYIVFQDVLANKLLKAINEFQKKSNLFILIHGFRKPFIKEGRSTTAMEDYGYLRASITKLNKENTSIKFLEIYWDGMFDAFIGEQSGTMRDVFKLFETEAQLNARITGYALRKIVSKIETKTYTIIAHSLGAQVTVSLLTNTYKTDVSDNFQQLETPSQPKIKICLIAPAMAASPFSSYYDRTTGLNFKKEDNYFITILFNENDIVLNKSWGIFGPGPCKYGDTSLGCNYKNEVGKLQQLFSENFRNSSLKIYDTTGNRDHRIKNYVKTVNFERYVKEVDTP